MRTRQAEAFWYEPLHRWQINVQRAGIRRTFTDSTPGKKGKHLAEAKADKWLERFTTEQSISNALDLYYEDKHRELKTASYKALTCMLDGHVRTFFPPLKKLSAISAYDWQKCVDLSGIPKKSSQKQLICFIGNFLKYCKARRWEVEWDIDLHTTDDAEESKAKQALTEKQIYALLACDKPFADFFKLALLTGCRKGELINLRWKDVSPDALTIRTGKTKNAARTVPLIAQAREVVKHIKEDAMVSEYLFVNQWGERISGSYIAQMWAKIKQSIGAEGYTIHELRHTFISVCKGEVNMTLLKQAVGHSASMDTIAVYGHATEQDLIDTAAGTQSAFDKIFHE